MSFWQIIRRSWVYYWQIHVAMVLAVALTTAVLTGALTVGDSMRGSLRQLTLDRLGPIEQVLQSQTFFDGQMVQQWQQREEFQAAFSDAVATIHFPAATLEPTIVTGKAQSSDEGRDGADGGQNVGLQDWASVEVWGMPQGLSKWHWSDDPFPVPEPREVVINQTAADSMGWTDQQVGQLLTLRLGKPSDVPTESFIATKDDSVTSLPRLTLKAIVPDEGLGRLSLTPGTEVPALVFLHLESLRRAIPDATQASREDIALFNTVLVAGKDSQQPVASELATAAFSELRPDLADAGLQLKHVQLNDPNQSGQKVLDYYSVSSTRMLIDYGQQAAIEQALNGLNYQPVLTYLANEIEPVPTEGQESTGDNGIPFSMVTALDWSGATRLVGHDGNPLPDLQPGEIILNQWAAERLNLEVGASVQIRYYEPETVDGDEVERSAQFQLVGIAALTEPVEPFRMVDGQMQPAQFDQTPTSANDPWLTPEVPGVTDAASIDNWDLPFETQVEPEDDDYWQFYRTTPKAFLSMQDGQRLWENRFGRYTSYRLPAETLPLAQLRDRLDQAVAGNPARVGIRSVPVKQMGLAGSQGSTPFDVLFLMFSMFVIASSLMLLGLFFRLGMQQRSRELGLWMALGFSEIQARRFWIQESLGSTIGGIVVGSGLGIAYAWLIAFLMRTAWVGAVASPFLYLHWSWVSILGGAIASLVVSLAVIWWSVRQATAVSARSLLVGGWNDAQFHERQARWWHACTVRRVLLVVALLLSVAGFFAVGDTQAVVFLGGGFLALTAVLLFLFDRLVHRTVSQEFGWTAMTQLNLSRQPLRSMIIITLVSLATFLIVAVSAFRLSPSERGTAGFDYVATTDVGVIEDFSKTVADLPAVETDGPTDQRPVTRLVGYGFRFHDGEHASCNNPFQAKLPQVLGVDQRFVERFDDPEIRSFAWAGTTATTSRQQQNPWHLLNSVSGSDDPPQPENDSSQAGSEQRPIPVVMDKNTAWYSLKVYLPGSQFKIQFPDAGEVTFQLVGLLDNAVLQGALLIGDADYVRLFPTDSGKRYFLLEQSPEAGREQIRALGQEMKKFGWQVKPADEVLANYMAVQNTYLSAFQSLGSLGLLLGTIGLIVAQYRSLLERRRELALMQAIGFERRKIQGLITGESTRLILNGFLAGICGALVCVLPHWISGAATLPWIWLLGTLGVILVLGLTASIILGRVIMSGRLVGLLRTE